MTHAVKPYTARELEATEIEQWNALAERGYKGIDLTDAHNPSVAKFKSQLGADLRMGLEIEKYNRPAVESAEAALLLARRAAAKLYRVTIDKVASA